MLLVQLLSHVRHELKLLVEGLLAHGRVLVCFLLFEGVSHELVSVAGEVGIYLLPKLILMLLKAQ